MSEPAQVSSTPAATTQTPAATTATATPGAASSAVTSPVSTTPPASLLSDAGNPQAPDASKSLLDSAKGEEGKEVAKEGEVKQGEEKKPEVKAPAVPEKYELKAPEGMQIDEGKLSAFSEMAKEIGLSNEQAQKLVDFQGKIVMEQQATQKAAFDKLQEDFYKETVAEYGPKLKEELVLVAKGRDILADKEVVELLNDAGLSNNKAIIRMFAKAGRYLSEGKLVDGQAAVDTPRSDAQILYPNLPSARR